MRAVVTVVLFPLCFCASLDGLAAQHQRTAVPGDSIRFTWVQTVEFQAVSGEIARSSTVSRALQGGLVGHRADSVLVRFDGQLQSIHPSEMENVRVFEAYQDRKRWGLVWGAVGGVVGVAYASCNPALLDDTRCTGSSGAWSVVQAGLFSALGFGFVGALLAPSHRWIGVDITSARPSGDRVSVTILVVRF